MERLDASRRVSQLRESVACVTRGTLACPVDDCPAEWPDTYGADGGRRARFLHLYRDHDFARGLPFKRLD